MGLQDFLKEAGEKLKQKAQASVELTEKVQSSGLNVENVKVSVIDGKATITGVAESQEVKEKVVLMVGNTEGIEVVDDQMTVKEVEEEVPQAQFYTVEKGDTLGGIAKKFYGEAGKYPLIFEANKPMLKSADLIYPGQSLRIPPL